MRWLISLGLWLCCASAAAQAPALSAGDYGLENEEWNGLGQFLRLARAQGATLQPTTALDFSTLTPEDRLILLFPTQEIDTEELANFVIDGGRVLLADDFGTSDKILERLGISRVDASSVRHDAYYLDRPGLPLFKPGGRHALLEGVQEVVANHPSALTTQGGAILPYAEPGTGLAYDMRLGRGKVVVVGDASLFINHMIGVKDNRIFLRNALDYLCLDAEPCAPLLVVGEVEVSGSYQTQHSPQDDVGAWFEDGLEELNGFLEKLANGIPGRKAMYYASLLLLLGTVAFLVTIFPWRRALKVAPAVGAPVHVQPLSEFEWNLLRYQRSGFEGNYVLPMAILRAEFERLFFRAVMGEGAAPPDGDPQRGPFLRRAAQAYIDLTQSGADGKRRSRAYKQTLQLLQGLGRVPPRHRLFLDSEAQVSERELGRVHRQCMEILETLGVKGDYERRTRRRAP